MADVTVVVAGRCYRIGCGAGEEAHLETLAAMLDAEALVLQRNLGAMPERRLLILTALTIADRLSETEQRVREVEGEGSEREAELTRRIEALAAQIEQGVNVIAARASVTRPARNPS